MSAGQSFLLDTNIISETRKNRADKRVIDFLKRSDQSNLFVSTVSLGELYKGVEIKRRSDPVLADDIGLWVDGIERIFAENVLPVTGAIARRWGELSADRSRPVIDTLIAATAQIHGLVLVTRNGHDLRGIDLAIIDPWADG